MNSAGNPVSRAERYSSTVSVRYSRKKGHAACLVEVEKEGVSRDEPPDVQGFLRWSLWPHFKIRRRSVPPATEASEIPVRFRDYPFNAPTPASEVTAFSDRLRQPDNLQRSRPSHKECPGDSRLCAPTSRQVCPYRVQSSLAKDHRHRPRDNNERIRLNIICRWLSRANLSGSHEGFRWGVRRPIFWQIAWISRELQLLSFWRRFPGRVTWPRGNRRAKQTI